MPSIPPVLDSARRRAAAERAVATCRARRELLTRISAGQLSLATALARADTDPVIAKAQVTRLLNLLPGCALHTREQALTRAMDTAVSGSARWQQQALRDALT